MKDDPVKKPFWRKLDNRGVQPIDTSEVEASQVGGQDQQGAETAWQVRLVGLVSNTSRGQRRRETHA